MRITEDVHQNYHLTHIGQLRCWSRFGFLTCGLLLLVSDSLSSRGCRFHREQVQFAVEQLPIPTQILAFSCCISLYARFCNMETLDSPFETISS